MTATRTGPEEAVAASWAPARDELGRTVAVRSTCTIISLSPSCSGTFAYPNGDRTPPSADPVPVRRGALTQEIWTKLLHHPCSVKRDSFPVRQEFWPRDTTKAGRLKQPKGGRG